MSISFSNPSKINNFQKTLNVIVVAMPVVGFIAATLAIIFWERGVQPLDLSLLVGMYALTFFGITVGYHRFFTHRAFQAGAFVRAFLAIAGCMAGQGPVASWVSHHRCHHLYSDTQQDFHSPNIHGEGFWGVVQGFWHAHTGWLLNVDWTPPYPYVSDLNRDKVVQKIDQLYILWVLLSLLIPTLLGGVLTGSWSGALRGLIWGGGIRIFLLHQFTFSVNSVCHLWGKRQFPTDDQSKNNLFVAIMTLGEGWHNNHHAFQHSARFGLRWWQLDFGWLGILALNRLGLVWNVKVPSSSEIELKSITSSAG
ncbi:acyl-CoA desaturase [Trichocoleus sp. DQ-U1]|uniref:acyl-CoA desaturase n=1 Tax=Trichocoleus sp. DQ-U1 TaxID=2933926 RepID=UPI003299E5FC